MANLSGEEPGERPKRKVKSFEIRKRLVYEAWQRVQANGGALGVDVVSIEQFEANEANNLYKLWNRMPSGSYFSGPVRAVEIPKDHGKGVRVLGVHPDKTKVVYCKDTKRRGSYEHTSSDLGYTSRACLAKGRYGFFVSFLPAMSVTVRKAKGRQIRAWHLNRRSGTELSGLAQEINPQVRGWINYYGAFYRSELYAIAARHRCAHRRAPRPMGHAEVQATARTYQQGMALAGCGTAATADALRPLAPPRLTDTSDCGSRMTGDRHVRFCESGRGRFPPATHRSF
ncbi:MAG: group II intron maturase-specific domain-containing protein [Acidimicrobiales bacterium]